MSEIMLTCMIIHNMLVDERRDSYVFDGIGRLRTTMENFLRNINDLPFYDDAH